MGQSQATPVVPKYPRELLIYGAENVHGKMLAFGRLFPFSLFSFLFFELSSSESGKRWHDNMLPLAVVLPRWFMQETSLKQLCKPEAYICPATLQLWGQ